MVKYYYLVAQLPTLIFDKEPLITIVSFLDEADKWLSNRNFRILSEVKLDALSIGAQGNYLWKRYSEFEASLRNDIAGFRKARKSGQDYKTTFLPVSMIKDGNPLEIEKKLMKYRWDFLGEMEFGHYFDLEVLVLFYLKLQILQRLSIFQKETGLQRFRNTTSVSLGKADEAEESQDAD